MEIRPVTAADLDRLGDIDGTIESVQYLHVDRVGEGLAVDWKIQQRPLREKLIQPNPLHEDLRFDLRQVVGGIEDGLALAAEHQGQIVAAMLAAPRPLRGTLEIVDLRVDYDFRRQGIGTALVFQCVQEAKTQGRRAVAARAKTNNVPANDLLSHCGFEMAGLDARCDSNHDLVKEAVTLFWYLPLD